MNHSTPGLPVHHQLLEFTQTHVHQVGDAIQPSHPLLSLSPPTLNLSQHQGRFQWVSSSHQVAKVLELQLQHQSFQWTPRTDLMFSQRVPCRCVLTVCPTEFPVWPFASLGGECRGGAKSNPQDQAFRDPPSLMPPYLISFEVLHLCGDRDGTQAGGPQLSPPLCLPQPLKPGKISSLSWGLSESSTSPSP